MENDDIRQVLNTISAIERTSYNTFIVWDLDNFNVLNCSFNLNKIFQHETITNSIENIFHRNIPETEQQAIKTFISKGLDFLNHSRKDIYSFSFSYHTSILKQDFQTTVFHRTTPINTASTTKDGHSKQLMLTALSFASHFDTLHPLMTDSKHINNYFYDRQSGIWKSFITPTLSNAEKNMLVLSTQGLTAKEIAAFINKSEETVKTYKRTIFEKLGATNISQAIAIAQNFNLI